MLTKNHDDAKYSETLPRASVYARAEVEWFKYLEHFLDLVENGDDYTTWEILKGCFPPFAAGMVLGFIDIYLLPC